MLPTLVTFLWRGWRPVYDHRHVNALARMLRAQSPKIKLVCITDMPTGITECETYPLWPAPINIQAGQRNCFTRLRLFDPEMGRHFGDWVCNIDLDCVVLGDITTLLDGQESFRVLAGIANPVNGSLWRLRVGTHPEVWSDFIRNPALAMRQIHLARHQGKPLLGSDQAWLSLKIKNPATWSLADGIQQLSLYQPDVPCKLLFCAGKHKPWDLACQQRAPEAYAVYQQVFEPQMV